MPGQAGPAGAPPSGSAGSGPAGAPRTEADIWEFFHGAGQQKDTKMQSMKDWYGLNPYDGRIEGLRALNMLTPLEYALQLHKYGLYSEMQPDVHNAVRDLIAELKDPTAANEALRAGLLGSVSERAGQEIAALQAHGGGESSKRGAIIRASNDANRTANEAEARGAMPGEKAKRMQAIMSILEAAAPDLSRLLQTTGTQISAPKPQSGLAAVGGVLGNVLGNTVPVLGGVPGGGGRNAAVNNAVQTASGSVTDLLNSLL